MPPTDERRCWLRFTLVLPVQVESTQHGFTRCVARNISPGGVFLEAQDLLPLGSDIQVFFDLPDGAGRICARGEVKNHYYLNYTGYNDRIAHRLYGMGVRFTDFRDDGLARLGATLGGPTALH